MARRLIIFDVDGTLVDSQDAIVWALSDAFAQEGVPKPGRAEMLSIVGLSLTQAFETLIPDAPASRVARLVTAYKQAFVRLRAENRAEAAAPMFAGARDLVMRLHGNGHALGVATGKARRGVAHFVEAHGLEGRFSVVQTADDAPSKPHPGMILNCLAATGVAPDDAVIVGDTEFDMSMGRQAGIRRIGVTWGYHPADRVLRGGAEAMARDMNHLSDLLDGLWAQ